MLPQVHEDYVRTGKVELIFLDLPLEMHSNAFKAAQAAACAGDQGMFWEMHRELFGHQRDLGPDRLPAYAEEIGLDVDAFKECLASGRHDRAIQEDVRTAHRLRITGTPAYVLGRRIPGGDKVQVLDVSQGVPPYEALRQKIDALLADE